jgi:multidrug resistance protein, MATE family
MHSSYSNHTLSGLLRVALPLIISSLGWTLMVAVDRILLARYDIATMDAVVSIGIIILVFEWGVGSIAVTSEVFAGQFNGLGKKAQAPIATWQMLIFCVICAGFLILIGIFTPKYLIPEEYYEKGKDFFTIIMCFLIFNCAVGAINGFFIGIKKTKVILYNALFCNFLNIILSYAFIFGIEGLLEPGGAKGAAIANSISLFVQFVIIFTIFISKKMHQQYQTRNFLIDTEIFLKCLCLGIPSSIGIIVEMTGNYIVQILIVKKLSIYVSNHNIALNLFVFCSFFLNGIHKSVSGLASNLIGQRDYHLIPSLMKSGLALSAIFSSLLLLFSLVFGKEIAMIYTTDPVVIANTIKTLPWIAAYYFFDSYGWVVAGVLIAGGDTKYIMLVNLIAVWVFKVIPLYFLLSIGVEHISLGLIISVFSALVYAILYEYRYRTNNWLKLKLS